MRADIIAVGDSAEYGPFFPVSCDYIRTELASLGCEVGRCAQSSGDSRELYETLKASTDESAIIFVLQAPAPETARTVAEVCAAGLGLGVIVDPALLNTLAAHAARSGRSYTKDQLEDFLLRPSSASAVPNPSGLVQGWCISAQKQLLMALPLVPSQLAAMFSAHVRSIVSAFSGNACRAFGVARVLDLDNESVASRLNIFSGRQNPRVTWTDTAGDCEIYVEATGATGEEAERLRNRTLDELRALFGVYYYGEGHENLQTAVVRRLTELHKTVATAESCTGGLLSERITEVPGSSRVFEFGLSAYANRVKIEKLGVPRSFIRDYGAISRRTAAAMAVGARKRGKADIGVGITGNAGPSADENKPVGLVYVAMADAHSVWVKKLLIQQPGADRDAIRSLAVLQALNMVRLYTMSSPAQLSGGTPISQVMRPGVLLMDRLRGRRADDDGLPAQHQQDEKTSANMKPAQPDGVSAAAPVIPAPRRIEERGKMSTKNPTPAGTPAEKTNLLQRLKRHQLTRNDTIRMIVLGACLVIFIGCMIYIGSVKMESVNNAKKTDTLNSIFDNESQISRDEVSGYPEDYIDEFTGLYQENSDVAGFIEIADTNVKYPVVQTSNNTDYDRVDFYKQSNQHGIPYVDYRVDLKKPSTNIVIYSHNMGDGQMFGELVKYKAIAYYREHPLVRFDSVYRTGSYKIFGIVVCKADDTDFLYHSQINLTEEEQQNFVQQIRARSIVNTTVDVLPTDTLLTMSTCDYSFKDENGKRVARFVVFARRVRDGESSDVDTAGATINTSPVMPAEWYAYIAKQQEEAIKQQEAEAAANARKGWLTDDEQKLTDAEQEALVTERKARAALLLTETEISNTSMPISDRLALMDQREAAFAKYLSPEEQKLTDVSVKVQKAKEYRELSLALLGSEEELAKYNTYQELYNTLSNKMTLLRLFLNNNEYTNYTVADKINLFTQRYAEGKLYLTEQQMLACADYNTLSAALQNKKALYTKWLVSSELAQTDPSVKDAAVAARQQKIQALIAAGSVTQEQIDKMTAQQIVDLITSAEGGTVYDTWLTPEQKTALKTQEEKKAAAEARQAEYLKWLTDRSATGYSAELESLLTQRKAMLSPAKLTENDVASLSSWTEIQALINESNANRASGDFTRWLTAEEKAKGYIDQRTAVNARKAAVESTRAALTAANKTDALAAFNTAVAAAASGEQIQAAIATATASLSSVKVTGVTISGGGTIDYAAGVTQLTLTAAVEPANATNKTVSWSVTGGGVTLTPNGESCTVTVSGTPTADFTVTVKATADGATGEATVTVKVTAAAQDVKVASISAQDLSLTVGGSGSVGASVEPANASNPALSYSCPDTSVATVDGSGNVTAVGEGTATVTITAQDGSGVSTSVTVTVTAAPATSAP